MPKHVLTVDEVEQIMRAVDLANHMGVRDRAILEALYSTGVRRLELKAVHAMAHPAHLEKPSTMPTPSVDDREARADLLADLDDECSNDEAKDG